jgi:hypothetical protein
VEPLWKSVWRLLKKQPYDPAIPLLGTHPKEISQHTIETPAHPWLLQHCSHSQVMDAAKQINQMTTLVWLCRNWSPACALLVGM